MSSYEISKSSLLSLKAEILRKQEDLTRAKANNVEKLKIIKKKTPLELKNKGVEQRQSNDLNDEEQDLLKLSRSKLETKAKLYQKLSGCQNEEISTRYLVNFNEKAKSNNNLLDDLEEAPDLNDSEDDQHFSDDNVELGDPSEEWVEYTDCLGRSRSCLRKDLEYFKSKDAELKLTVDRRNLSKDSLRDKPQEDQINTNLEEKNEEENHNKESELMSADMRRENLRQQWEKEEEELRNKADIHYQNVLFNEARQHGVGYYAFSKDEEERAKQQEALKKIREETEQHQKKAEELKALRGSQMAARLKAARNRRRARLGLPPEEEEEDKSNKKADTEPEKKPEEDKSEEMDKLNEREKLLMEARKRHIRPWDVGKEGVESFYEMSQEEWNEKKRQERPAEFAPPKIYNKREFSGMKLIDSDIHEDADKSLRFTTKTPRKKNWNLENQNRLNLSSKLHKSEGDTISKTNALSQERLSDNGEDEYLQKYDAYEKTKLENQHLLHEKQFYDPEEPTIDVSGSDDDDDSLLQDYKMSFAVRNKQNLTQELQFKAKGVEIAPPSTFEYYGPSGSKRKQPQENINIADSIEAGLKFLRSQSEKRPRNVNVADEFY